MSNFFKKLNDRPRWLLNVLLLVICVGLIGYLSTELLNIEDRLDNLNLSIEERRLIGNFTIIIGLIGCYFSSFVTVVIYFLVILFISKIFKRKTDSKRILNSVILMMLFTSLLKLTSLFIQFVFNISLLDYQINSLNIFNHGSMVLSIFNLELLLNTYLIFLIYNIVCGFSKKHSLLISLAISLISIFINIILLI